jgi:hypothetical protein
MNAEQIRIQTLHWIETIVIGLDLCPFGAVALADRDGWPRSVLHLATSRGVDPISRVLL